MDAARTALSIMASADGVNAALGFWAQIAARVRPEWVAELPPGTFGELSGDPGRDQAKLDAWANDQTNGLIERFPVSVHPDLMFALATALAVKTSWRHKFSDEITVPKSGAWQGRRLASLKRTTTDLDELQVVEVAGEKITMTRVAGDNGIDVILALGVESSSPSSVLTRALDALSDTSLERVTGSQLLHDRSAEVPSDWGPGLSVVSAQRESLSLATTRFTVRSEHDLLANASVFGLEAVAAPGRGHFSRISDVPLRVDEARQSAVAIFSATGFEAAAVTAIGVRAVSMPVYRARGIAVSYNRPFGFVTVDRATDLVLFTGWVDTPESS
jgi:serine protease inhibitor